MTGRQKKGQSILEYVITLTVIVAAIMAASGHMRTAVRGGMDRASDSIAHALSTAAN